MSDSDEDIVILDVVPGNGEKRALPVLRAFEDIVFPSPRRVIDYGDQPLIDEFARSPFSIKHLLRPDQHHMCLDDRVLIIDPFIRQGKKRPRGIKAPPKTLAPAKPYAPPKQRILITSDITMGVEPVPIPMYIDLPGVSDEEVARLTPRPFKYARRNLIQLRVPDEELTGEELDREEHLPFRCECAPGGCHNLGMYENRKHECACRRRAATLIRTRTGSVIKLRYGNEEAYLSQCGPECGCRASCYNALPAMLQHRLEIFMCRRDMGFGVRTLTNIRPGQVIAEYCGELICENELIDRVEKDYGHNEYSMNITYGGEKERRYHGYRWPFHYERYNGRALSREQGALLHYPPLFVDALDVGNVTRYINHSCLPNCAIIIVQTNSRLPSSLRLFIISVDPIPAGSELFLDYGKAHNAARNCRCFGPLCAANPDNQRVNYAWISEKQKVRLLQEHLTRQCVAYNAVIERASQSETSGSQKYMEGVGGNKKRCRLDGHDKECESDDDDDIICI